MYTNAHYGALQKAEVDECEWRCLFSYFFKASICKIDQIITINDIIPGIYRSGALISYLGATGSDLLY